MGLYMYVTDEDRITKRKVSNSEMNEEFQEALKYDPSLMIEEFRTKKKTLFFSMWEYRYNIYHETPAFDGSAYQARLQGSASGTAAVAIAYLHGIINGCVHQQSKSTPNT